MNEALLAKAAAAKLVRTNRVRADTTVIPANVAYPTDSGLLAKAVGKIARTVRRVQAAGGATRTRTRDRRRAAGRRVREIASKLRTRGKLAGRRAPRRSGGSPASWPSWPKPRWQKPPRCCATATGRCALDELAAAMARTRRIAVQTRTRLAGQTPAGASRLVSLHDPEARPIRKGRLDRPVEFGYKAQVVDNDDGIVLDHTVEPGAAPDAPQLAPAVERIRRRTGRTPAAVTADRGYGEPVVDHDLLDLGVRTIAIPRKAKPAPARRAVEHGRGFRQLVKWRTGCEGRISALKRSYGWNRSRIDRREGAAIWCGHGVFTHNLIKIGALTG